RLGWSRAPAGTDGEWTLRWNGAAFDVAMADRARGVADSLATRPLKPLGFQGAHGDSRKGAGTGGGSQYYSCTPPAAAGAPALGGRTVAVRGESWMDKEFGSNQLGEGQVGWDWLSLQLADGRELMLYRLRDRAGRVDFAHGTLVSRAGEARYLAAGDFTVRATGSWKSRARGAECRGGWVVGVRGADLGLEVAPELGDQGTRSELVRDLVYWGGAVSVRGPDGAPAGRGYVELTGYGNSRRPAG